MDDEASEAERLRREVEELRRQLADLRASGGGCQRVAKTPEGPAQSLQALLDCVRDGVYCLDREGRITFVNDVIVERSGRPAEWFYARSYLDILVPDDRPRAREIVEAALRGQTAPPAEYTYPAASGGLE